MIIKANGFDFDGTLVDSLERKLKNAGQIFQKVGGINSKDVIAAYKKFSGIPRKDLFNKIAKRLINRQLTKEEFERLSINFNRLNKEIYCPDIIYEDVLSTLKQLKKTKKILYISSSVPDEILKENVETTGLEIYFDEILGSQSIYGNKGIGHTNYMIEKYNLRKNQIAFIGDEKPDIMLSKDAGIVPIGITNTISSGELSQAGACKTIEKISELINIERSLRQLKCIYSKK